MNLVKITESQYNNSKIKLRICNGEDISLFYFVLSVSASEEYSFVSDVEADSIYFKLMLEKSNLIILSDFNRLIIIDRNQAKIVCNSEMPSSVVDILECSKGFILLSESYIQIYDSTSLSAIFTSSVDGLEISAVKKVEDNLIELKYFDGQTKLIAIPQLPQV
jgi:hypothetical protein